MTDTVTIPVGDANLRLPVGGQYEITRTGNQITVKPKNAHSAALIRKVPPVVTDFSAFAARMGVTMKPKPEPMRRTAPADVNSRASRPLDINTMVGQDHLRLRIKVHVMGRDEGHPVGHVLLEGPPGLGKTSLGSLIASLTGGQMVQTSGTALKSVEQLANVLSEIKDDDVLFVDEVHMTPVKVRAALLTAMEDYRIDLSDNQAAKASAESHMLNRFVLVAATTNPGGLDRPMLDRFELRARVEYYSGGELTEILNREADAQGWKVEPEAVESMVRRSRGTPRVAKKLLSSARKFAKANFGDDDAVITDEMTSLAFELAGIDENGLEQVHRQVLWQLCKVHRGGPVGVDRIAVSSDMDNKSLREVESYLIREHYLINTSRGRVACDRAYLAVGMDPKPAAPKAADLIQQEQEI